MKHENSDICLQQLYMKFIFNSRKTIESSEGNSQGVRFPLLLILHFPQFLRLSVTAEMRDRVISPTPDISPPFNLCLSNNLKPFLHQRSVLL
jgi:virulence-associated protein VagC